MIGNRLRQLREEKDLTQEELGKKLNLTKANISKYESGKLEPNLETINYLAEYFNVTTDYLLGRSDIRKPETEPLPLPGKLHPFAQLARACSPALTRQIKKIDRLHVFLDIHAVQDGTGKLVAVFEHLVIAAAAALLAVKTAGATVQRGALTFTSLKGRFMFRCGVPDEVFTPAHPLLQIPYNLAARSWF